MNELEDWRMWVSLFFMLAAISIYVMSNDLTFFGLGHRQAPASDARGKSRRPNE